MQMQCRKDPNGKLRRSEVDFECGALLQLCIAIGYAMSELSGSGEVCTMCQARVMTVVGMARYINEGYGVILSDLEYQRLTT